MNIKEYLISIIIILAIAAGAYSCLSAWLLETVTTTASTIRY